MTLEEILEDSLSERERVTALQQKNPDVPAWDGPKGLEGEYDPDMHPVMDRGRYPDIVEGERLVRVTRIALGFQTLAAKRMSELVCGIPVKRVYRPTDEKQKQIAGVIEAIFDRVRINAVNTDRFKRLYAGCEIFTLWYAVKSPNSLYGIPSLLKLRCRTFSPMLGDRLYPLFDEYGDMRAMSIGYTRRVGGRDVNYFDTYTDGPDSRHIKWSDASGEWERMEDERTTLLKIPGVYAGRSEPIWEQTSPLIYEWEWTLSRNGNYLRENSKPLFCVFADEIIRYGDEKGPDSEGKAVMQYPAGASASYVTWPGAPESLKFQTEQLRSLFFTQLQLPDWSYEKMSQQAMSGESRKQMFIDAELKVGDESGALMEFCDREVNVVKAYVKLMLPEEWHASIDALPVETVVTPYRITDRKEKVDMLMTANGGKPVMSQRETIEDLGVSDDVDRTLAEIREEESLDSMDPADMSFN